jgi:hypothetical protein
MKNLAVEGHSQAQEEYYNDGGISHHKNELIKSGDNFHIPKLHIG